MRKAEYLAGHIPGAVFFDILMPLPTAQLKLPHMLPSADEFAGGRGRARDLARSDTVVVYDGAGLGGAPRVWWTFRAFGARNVLILDGGFPKWIAEGPACRIRQRGSVPRAQLHAALQSCCGRRARRC